MKPPTLLAAWLSLLAQWRTVFPSEAILLRARRHALGALLVLGRATVSRILWTNGQQDRSWSGEYFLFSRARWEPQALFGPILQQALEWCPGRLVGVAMDDTRLRKTGRSIPNVTYYRDPMGPPFHVNLMLGLRFLQSSLLLPLHRLGPYSARALPIRFEEVSTVKKPSKRASPETWEQYKKDRKQFNLSQRIVESMAQLRLALDEAGGSNKTLVITGDGSFCNRTVFAGIAERTQLLVRARKDARLCFPAPSGGRRLYDVNKFTPEQVRQDKAITWKTTRIFYGGKRHTIRYKEVSSVLWQYGARTRRLRLFVIAPTAYRKRKAGRRYYRQAAYLFTTDLTSTVRQLIQLYFDRWQIEVNHREEKDTLGVGHAQLWNADAVPKQPPLVVAAYSALHLCALRLFGPTRNEAYAALPKWRNGSKRPSCQDLVNLLRQEAAQHPELTAELGIQHVFQQFVAAAAA
jgi:hypothetical protein